MVATQAALCGASPVKDAAHNITSLAREEPTERIAVRSNGQSNSKESKIAMAVRGLRTCRGMTRRPL